MFILVLLAFAAQDTAGVGSIAGTIRNDRRQPAANIRVCLPSADRCVNSDPSGAFRLTDIRAGSYRLEITAPGQPPIVSEDVTVRAGLAGTVDVTLPAVDAVQQTLTVSDSVFVAPEEVKTSSFLVQRYEIFKAAGAQQDVSRYIQTLPGVGIGTNDFRNDLIVRGGSPLENLFVVDNVEIPNINNFANFASAGGTTSILDADLIRDVTFLSGGYPAPFTNRTSSVLQIAQREGSRDGFSGRVLVGFGRARRHPRRPPQTEARLLGLLRQTQLSRCLHQRRRLRRRPPSTTTSTPRSSTTSPPATASGS